MQISNSDFKLPFFPFLGHKKAYSCNIVGECSPENIQISQLNVYYRSLPALENLNLEVKPGRLTGIIGPNGAGKSTLMKAMLGLVTASRGKVCLQGQALAKMRSRVAYVPQRSQIDWNYPATVWDVVLMGRVQKTGWLQPFSANSRRIATQALVRVGMEAYRNRPIGRLSGGQQQRVFLARAIAQQGEVFCFDEPFVGVDQKTETILFQIFRELADEGKIVLVVNHDLGASITNFDDLILLNRQLIAAGSRQEVLTQKNLHCAYGGKVVFYGD